MTYDLQQGACLLKVKMRKRLDDHTSSHITRAATATATTSNKLF
jgi:hypothetical protein